MDSYNFSCRQARQVDMVEYLEKLGYRPQRITNNDCWYLSPLRDEKEASFKVNRKLNVWYDYALGKGGNIIDFGILFHKCSVKELLEMLRTGSFNQQQTTAVSKPENEDEKKLINVLGTYEITDYRLCNYLSQRKIPVEVAEKYCREVRYKLYGKVYAAIGFKNNAGGYELRSPNFKGSSSPKDVTLIDNGAKEVAVIEGFFSFLSYLVLHQNQQQHLTNFLVLNSLSFFEKSRPLMEKHEAIHLYLDHDHAGITSTQKALEWSRKYVDWSHIYKNHKDLNECLVQPQHAPKQSRGVRKGL